MFITLEGIEGSGKTTQIRRLEDYFKDAAVPCVVTRQPGGTPIGEKIRAILLDPSSKDLDATAELLLYMADRAQHINTCIKPQLAAGKTVICDRYFDATLVYQGFARALDVALLKELHRILFADLKPDLTLLLDLPVEMGLARARSQLKSGARPDHEGRFEAEDLKFHHKVRAGYLELARQEPDRIRIIDASREPDTVYRSLIAVIEQIRPPSQARGSF
jgi:dTMP kinase